MIIFFFTVAVGPLLAPVPAQAQWGVTTLADIPAAANVIIDKIKTGWMTTLELSAMRSISYFMRKVAYDSAVWLASGGKGQSPLANTKNFGDYLKNTAGDAAMEGIAALEDGFKVNLCKIPDVKIDLAFRIGLRTQFNVGPPAKTRKCSFQDFKKNWSGDAWKSKYGSKEGLLKQFNASLKIEDTDFGIYMDSVTQVGNVIAKRNEGNLLDRQEGQGLKNVTSKISGDILTPGQMVKKEAEAASPSEQQKKDEAQINAAIGSGFFEILPATISTFLGTLAKTMVENFKNNGMFPFGLCFGEHRGPECSNSNQFLGNVAALPESQGAGGGLAAAQAAFSSLLQPNSHTGSGDSKEILGQLADCTEPYSLYKCRADEGIISALQAADYETITIKKAMNDKRWLHADWRLYGPDRTENNINQHCADPAMNAYCYANIKVLRQLRILPLGFELAVLKSDPDSPVTLGDVVNGYDICDYNYDSSGNITGVNYHADGEFKYCHLIDPNWVIKLPPTRCRAMAFGEQPLSSDAPYRIEECVDSVSCVAYDNNGNCTSYGYCAREQNVWNFGDSKKCDPYYDSCLNFTDATGQSAAYLKRTVDTGSCNSDTVGCASYSLTQNRTGDTGAWQTPVLNADLPNYNSGIHFNSNVSSLCSAGSAGCTAFRTNTLSSVVLNYRQAPDYLGCYDSDLAAVGVQWPGTAADMSRITPRPECDNYAKVCIADEVGCNEYSDAILGDKFPAKFTPLEYTTDATTGATKVVWNDQCDAKCVGYDSYREMPSNYSNGTNVAYVIPKLAQSCTVADDGCSGFTNMNEVSAGGGEQVEYFSLLRSCVKPDPANPDLQKNFYTYESTASGGYQLKSYTLEQDTIGTSDPDGNAGGPKYFYKTDPDLTLALSVCNKTAYDLHLATDCRQFNDDNGNVYYRLLAQVIPVSDKCTPYRLNSTEFAAETGGGDLGTDPICFQNGEYRNGFCYYNGLPAGAISGANDIKSKVCGVAQETCRAYKGNTGNNIKPLVKRDFEEAEPTSATADFTAVGGGTMSQSFESVIPQEHSLSYVNSGPENSGVSLALSNSSSDVHDYELGAGYTISFWAKGNISHNLDVDLVVGSDTSNFVGEFSVGETWQLYRFNVSNIQGDGSSYSLNIAGSGAKTIYLDNLQIIKNNDIYLVKKSVNIPTVCDSSPTDNLPGEALGCRAYGVSNNASARVNLHNFSYLCREGAVGCTGLYSTYNTLGGAIDSSNKTVAERAPRAYQIKLDRRGVSGRTALEMNSGQTLVRTLADDLNPRTTPDIYSCTVPVGETYCYVKNIFGHTKAEIETGSTAFSGPGGGDVYASFVDSSYYVPGDATTPIFLVANQSASCQSADLGCTYAGLQRAPIAGATTFDDVLIKNDPATYDKALCTAQAVGCNAYTSGASSYYFKDPVASGQKVCQYQTGKVVNGVESSGWFWGDNIGTCSGGGPVTYCRQGENDCAAGNTCVGIGLQPCYPDYVQPGNTFGLWSYGDTGKYNNFVGACTAEQSGCTAFTDKSDNVANYLIKDTVSVGTCAGRVSRKEGCALFEESGNPSKLYDTKATYLLSDNQDSDFVEPINNPATNDANVILQVSQDRQCGEWLACQSSHPNDDGSAQICDAVGRCNQAPTRGGADSISSCANFVDASINPYYGKIMLPGLYQTRDTKWGDMDFSGYTFNGMYQPDELSQLNIGSGANPDWRLVKMIKCGSNITTVCKDTTGFECNPNQNDKSCGNGRAVCKGGYCVQTGRGDTNFNPPTVVSNGQPTTLKPSCRDYQYKDAPYISTVDVKHALSNANFCDEAGDFAIGAATTACECDYTQVSYGDDGLLNKYFNYFLPNKYGAVVNSEMGVVPEGICQAGDNNGAACSSADDCPSGTCIFKKQELKILGWHGYCLEPDYSRPLPGARDQFSCLSWLPITNPAGFADRDSQHLEAGYIPTQQLTALGFESHSSTDLLGQYYCLDATHLPSTVSRYIWVKAGEFIDDYQDPDSSDAARNAINPIKLGGQTEDYYNILSFSAVDHQDKEKVATAIIIAGASLLLSPLAPLIGLASALFGFLVPDQGQNARVFYPYTQNGSDPTAIYQSDIELVKFQVDKHDDEDQQTSIYIYPNVYNGDKPYMVYDIPDDPDEKKPFYKHSNVGGIYVAGNFMGKENFPAFFYASKSNDFNGDTVKEGYIDKDGQIDYKGWVDRVDPFTNTGPDGDKDDSEFESVIKGNLFGRLDVKKSTYTYLFGSPTLIPGDKLEPVPDDSLAFFSAGKFAGNPYVDHTVYDDVCPGGGSTQGNLRAGDGNWHGVVMHFDANTHKFLGFWMYYCDQSNLDGEVSYLVTFILRNQCSIIADTRFDFSAQSSPWTNRLWQGIFAPTITPAVTPRLTYNTPYAPFGSLNITLASNPYAGHELSPSYLRKLPLYIDPRVTVGENIRCFPGFDKSDENCVVTLQDEKPLAPIAKSTAFVFGGEGNLKQLFAKPLATYSYNKSSISASDIGSYQGYIKSTTAPYDHTELLSLTANAPQVKSVGTCNADGKCLEGDNGLTINDQTSGSVVIKTSPGKAVMKFYAHAHEEQMPIRSIWVDWGDGKNKYESGDPSFFRNRYGHQDGRCDTSVNFNYCRNLNLTGFPDRICSSRDDCKDLPQCVLEKDSPTDSSGPLSFGRILDRTCDDNYYRFDTVYECSKTSANWKSGADCSDLTLAALYGGCCEFTPRVRVRDNWGWCNGTCGVAGSPGGTGCYGDTECLGLNTGAWTEFAGTVLVPPRV